MSLAMEQSADRASGGDAATVLRDETADIRCRAVPVVCAYFHEQRYTIRPINLICQIFKIRFFTAARAFFDGSLDVVLGHVRGTTLEQHHAQARVHVRVATGELGRDGYLAAQFRENLSAFGVNPAFEMLDLS